MNELARVVHAVVVDGKAMEAVSTSLTEAEKTALKELQPALRRSPADLSRELAAVGSQQPWL
jgi:hypothetical protein